MEEPEPFAWVEESGFHGEIVFVAAPTLRCPDRLPLLFRRVNFFFNGWVVHFDQVLEHDPIISGRSSKFDVGQPSVLGPSCNGSGAYVESLGKLTCFDVFSFWHSIV